MVPKTVDGKSEGNNVLYHYTAGAKLQGIAQFGLTIGDVLTDLKANKGRVGVWLTTSPEPDGMELEGSLVDTKRFRIEVDIGFNSPDVSP